MPLPVSAQTYMPNPLTSSQASQMGLSYGQGIIQGGLNAAQSTANIAGGIQDIQMKPEKLDLDRRRVEVQENSQDWQEEYQSQSLDIQQEQNDIRREEIASAERRAQMRATLTGNKKAEDAKFTGLSSSLIVDGDREGILGEISDTSSDVGRERRKKFITRVGTDKEFGQPVIDKIQDDLASGAISDPAERELFQGMIRDASAFKRVATQQEKAAKAAQFLDSTLGFSPELGKEYRVYRDPKDPSLFQVQEIDRENKRFRTVATFDDEKPGQKVKYLNAIADLTRLNHIQRETVDAIKADAKKRADIAAGKQTPQGQTLPDEQARPAKENPVVVPQGSRSTRLGLEKAAPTAKDEKDAVRETQIEQKRRARQRMLQEAGKVDVGAEEAATKYPSILKSDFGSGSERVK